MSIRVSENGLRFPRSAHLLTAAEFSRCFSSGKKVGGRFFLLVFCTSEDEQGSAEQTRLGMAVSRKVDKRAVERNRLRRVIREWFRLNRSGFPSGDFVVVGKPPARGAASAVLTSELATLIRRLPIDARSRSRHNEPPLADSESPHAFPAEMTPADASQTRQHHP